MKLRLKLLLILASVWVIISLVIYIYSDSALIKNYENLERNTMVANIAQTKNTLDDTLSALNIMNKDWSQWNDTYDFMINKNPTFIQSNLTDTTFKNAKINFILFFNMSGKLFYGLFYNLDKKVFTAIPNDLLTHLKSINADTLAHSLNQPFNKLGFIKAKEGFVAVSTIPILTSEGKGPMRGILVMGYYFTNQHIEALGNILKMQVNFLPVPTIQQEKMLSIAYAHLNHGQPYYISTQNNNIINGYQFIPSIENKPVGMLVISVPRTLYKEGIYTIQHYIAIVISIGILFLIIIWYLLKKFIVDRVINISQQVIRISAESQFSERIESVGHDEMEQMAMAINSLMEIIELSQEQLKYRIFQRTEELEQLSKLNKNLYLEMQHQKEVEAKLRKGEKLLRQLAYYDALTGLPNRIFFNEILQKMIAKAERDGTGIAIIFMDADKLKSINDTYGHDIGDKFLIHTAKQLKNSIKESDFAAPIRW